MAETESEIINANYPCVEAYFSLGIYVEPNKNSCRYKKKLQEYSGRKYFQNVATESIEISITYLLMNEESKIGLKIL